MAPDVDSMMTETDFPGSEYLKRIEIRNREDDVVVALNLVGASFKAEQLYVERRLVN